MNHHRTAIMARPSDELYLPILGKGHKGFPLPRFHIQLLTVNCPTNRDHLSIHQNIIIHPPPYPSNICMICLS